MGGLGAKVFEGTQEINNDPQLLPVFFLHVKLAR
jgi:hypothetical protein